MKQIMLGGMLLVALAACERSADQQRFDGQLFRGDAKSDRQNRQEFTASVRPVSASLEGAIQAAEFEGIKHCIRYFGTSDINWTIGPDTPPEALTITDDTLTFTGSCVDGL